MPSGQHPSLTGYTSVGPAKSVARHTMGVTIEAYPLAAAAHDGAAEGGDVRPQPAGPGGPTAGPTARIDVELFAPDLVRVRMIPPHARHPRSRRPYAVVPRARTAPPFSMKEEPGAVTITTDALTLHIATNPVRITYGRPDGSTFTADSPAIGMAWRRGAVLAHHVPAQPAVFYGLGEKTGFLNLAGRRFTMWNTDVSPHTPDTDPLYASIPFFIGFSDGKAYGVFLDNTFRSHFDLGHRGDGTVSWGADGGYLDTYFFAGPHLSTVVERYTELTGRMPMPPLWTLGYHQCRYSYETEAELLQVAHTLRERGLPCDALYLDIHYMDGYRVFTFHPRRFPDPKRMTAQLRELGYRTVAIVNPGVKVDADYPPFQEGTERGFWAVRGDGTPYVGEVWPGAAAFPDFTRPDVRTWWAGHHRFLFDMGIDGIWNDMNEPADFAGPDKTLPLDVEFGPGDAPVLHEEVHNVYGLLMAEATREAYAAFRPGERPFIITRAGYAGIQRHAVMWTGDNSSWWEHLLMSVPMGLNMSLSGIPFVGADIGGFLGDCDGELLARWTQLGAFMPLFRNHSILGSRRQEPYQFGEPYESICRRALTLRYQLIPYLYTLVQEAAAKGTPIIRPIVWEFPHDPQTARLSDQFMVGPFLLVAPVYVPAADHRAVYLPPGWWLNYWTGEKLEGGRSVLAPAPLDTIPLFLREGAVLPHGLAMAYTGEKPQRLQQVDVFPAQPGRFSLYIDDGTSLAYQQGEAAWIDFEHTGEPGALHITFRRRGADLPSLRWPVGAFRVNGIDTRPRSVSLAGQQLPEKPSPADVMAGQQGWAFHPEQGRLYVGVHHDGEDGAVDIRW